MKTIQAQRNFFNFPRHRVPINKIVVDSQFDERRDFFERLGVREEFDFRQPEIFSRVDDFYFGTRHEKFFRVKRERSPVIRQFDAEIFYIIQRNSRLVNHGKIICKLKAQKDFRGHFVKRIAVNYDSLNLRGLAPLEKNFPLRVVG